MGTQIFVENDAGTLEEVDGVRFADLEVGSSAELGDTDTGRLAIDDPGSALYITGLRRWQVKETTATPPLVASGRIMARTVNRGDADRQSLRLGADRWWDCDIVDENFLMGIRIVRGTAANRPAESAGERLAWLLSTSFVTFVDNGHVTYPSTRLDPNDYTGQTAKDVIADCALPGGYNYFVLRDTSTDPAELFFMLPTSSDWASTITISNDLADVDNVTCFPPIGEHTVRISPERIASGVFMPYSPTDGSAAVYVTDTATGDQYAYVDKAAPSSNVHTSAKATVIANRLLAEADEEDERAYVNIKVPAAQVNDIRAWHRVGVKMTHWPGWTTFRDARVLHRAVAQAHDGEYVLSMELTPVEDAQAIQTVTLVATNTVTVDAGRNAVDTEGSLTFVAGQVWRWTLSNTQHDVSCYTRDFALGWDAGGSGHTIRGWGGSVYYLGPDFPTAKPAQGSYPYSGWTGDTGTFTITETGTGTFTMYGNGDYVGGSPVVNEQWTCVLERIA